MSNLINKSAKELKTVINNYVLNAIDSEGYGKHLNTDKEKLQFLADTFAYEFSFDDNLKRYPNHQSRFTHWIMGLPSCFNIDFQYVDIIKVSKELGTLSQNSTSRQEDRITAKWFNFISAKTFKLMAKHKVNIKPPYTVES